MDSRPATASLWSVLSMVAYRNVAAPRCGRGARYAMNPSRHVGLVGKAGVSCDSAQAVRPSGCLNV